MRYQVEGEAKPREMKNRQPNMEALLAGLAPVVPGVSPWDGSPMPFFKQQKDGQKKQHQVRQASFGSTMPWMGE